MKSIVLVAVCLACLQCSNPVSSFRLPSAEEIAAEFEHVPCKNEDRLAAAIALFERRGARSRDIAVHDYGIAKNLIVQLPGSSPTSSAEKIMVGAHFDKTADGCGALDNWTGIVASTYVFRAVKEIVHARTFLFVSFGEEEKGLLGSKAMVDAITPQDASSYCAMVNLDTVGRSTPRSTDEMSTKAMLTFTETVAKSINVPFAHASVPGVYSDSMPFASRGIPAITIFAMTDDWPTILHRGNDTADKVQPESVQLAYRLALSILMKLDTAPCDSVRER